MTRAPLYHWKGSPTGRQALCQILLYAQDKAGDRLLQAAPGDYGVSADEMRQWVLQRCPELEDEHMRATGQPLTGKKMMARLYNMFDVLPDGSRRPSGEHPAVHEDVAATWNVVSGAQTDLFKETSGERVQAEARTEDEPQAAGTQ